MNSQLVIPDLDPDGDTLTAALAYAAAGWYVLPVRRGTKDPGSVVGKKWHAKSSRHPKQITAWFAGTDQDIALHCGRSGAVVFDADAPDKLPDVLRRHLVAAPFQSTRPDVAGRGHYVFTQPSRRTLGNSTGRLGGGWGEIRGHNGVIIVAPSHHADGGRYQWESTGAVPVLPAEIAAQLDDASPAEDAVTDGAVAAFIADHRRSTRPAILHGWTSALHRHFKAGDSRHTSTVSVVTGAMKEARAGFFAAQEAIDALQPMFIDAVAQPPTSSRQGEPRTGATAESEWAGILAWAVGQAKGADLDDVRARTDKKMPESPPPQEPPPQEPPPEEPPPWAAVVWPSRGEVADEPHRSDRVETATGEDLR
jgi:Bifunctional DNA primase/polymerase, N-terminal